jgi:hypothetical protein
LNIKYKNKNKMKNYSIKIIGLFMLLAVISLSSCKKDIEAPPFVEPHFTMPAGATLKNLIDVKAFVGSASKVIDSNWYIRATVVATDQSGNYYKDIVMQDTTGGIDVKMEKYSIFNDYPLGQVLYISLKGLYFSYYNGTYSLGYLGGTGIVTIPTILIDQHIFRDKFPGVIPTPVEITSANISLADRYVNTLVVFNKVGFADAGAVFADPLYLLGGMTPRNFSDSLGTYTIQLRSSTYANFKNRLLPNGYGSVRGILTKYGSTYQFCIRDINDVYGFPNDNSALIFSEPFSASLGGFTGFSVTGAQLWNWTTYGATMTGFANSINNENEDWLISPTVDLTSYHKTGKISFSHAINKGDIANVQTNHTLWISTDFTGNDPSGGTWTQLTIPVYPPGNTWTVIKSGDVIIPPSFLGKKIRFAFEYKSSTTESATWEIIGVKVKAE